MKTTITLLMLTLVFGTRAQYRFDDGTLTLKMDQNNKFGFVNQKDEWIIAPTFDEAMALPQVNAAVVHVDSVFRFIRPDGKWANELQLENIYFNNQIDHFLCYAKIKGLWGALNDQFAFVIPAKYSIRQRDEFMAFYLDNSSYLKDNSMLICAQKDKYGAINSRSEQILPFQYDDIRPVRFGSPDPNVLILKYKGKWGVAKTGEESKAKFIYEDYLETALDSIRVFMKDKKWRFVNVYTGEEKTEYSLPEGNGLAATIDVCKNGKWGLMNGKGQILTELRSDWMMSHPQVFSEYTFVPSLYGRMTVKYGLLDPDGKLMQEADMIQVIPVEGDFIVERESGFGLVSRYGKWALPPFHQEIKYLCLDLFAPKTSGKCVVVNNYGTKIYSDPVDEVRCMNEILAIRKQEKWGFVTKTGTVLFQPRYDEIGNEFINGYCLVKYDGRYGVIDRFGNVAIPFAYDEVDPAFDYFKTSDVARFKFEGKWYDVKRTN